MYFRKRDGWDSDQAVISMNPGVVYIGEPPVSEPMYINTDVTGEDARVLFAMLRRKFGYACWQQNSCE